METPRMVKLIVCVNVRKGEALSCGGQGSLALADTLEQEIAQRGLPVTLKRIECLGECKDGPNMRIAPGGSMFHHCNADTLPEVLTALEQAVQPTG